jgi:hypothetical protein
VVPIAPATLSASPHCLQAALDYAARGWSIFPVPVGTKKSHWKAKPGEARWGATKDAGKIRRAFAQWPNANVGLPTDAANGFWVLDADTLEGHGKDGIGALAALVAEHGPLPDTLRAESPTGSQHWYFQHPKGAPVPLRTGWREGIDIKGEGGMVLAPPSVKGGKAFSATGCLNSNTASMRSSALRPRPCLTLCPTRIIRRTSHVRSRRRRTISKPCTSPRIISTSGC